MRFASLLVYLDEGPEAAAPFFGEVFWSCRG